MDKLRSDYLRWHPAQVATKDIDPVYPMLKELSRRWRLNDEQRAWLVVCHVVWYHPGSTLAGFQLCPSVDALPDTEDRMMASPLMKLPCGTERRSHRPKQPLVNHLLGLRRTFAPSGVTGWVEDLLNRCGAPKEAWLELSDELAGLVGNGRWASYKTTEMLQKVCGYQIEAADAGHRYSSGPRRGLENIEPACPIGNTPKDVRALDILTQHWADELGEKDLAQVETSLCDFNSLLHGRYYLGHDIDSMQQDWNNPVVDGYISQELWEIREDLFASEMLGELNDWNGVRKEANKHYQRTGEMLYVP